MTIWVLVDGSGDAMLGKLCCTLCGGWRSMKTDAPKDRVRAETYNNLRAHRNVGQVHMHRKLKKQLRALLFGKCLKL